MIARKLKPKSRESQLDEPRRIKELIAVFQKVYPDAKCSLDHQNAFQLLVATILSAQCTDARVNRVTPKLFEKLPTPEAMAKSPREEIESLIASTGFYRNKAKSLQTASEKIVREYGGRVPDTMEELSSLPGVGRKTANVVLGNVYENPAGIVVDTHVKRLSFRLGFTKKTQPDKIEIELNTKIPKEHWVDFPHWLIHHGRTICMARNPQCGICPVAHLCPKKGVTKAMLAKQKAIPATITPKHLR